MKQNLILIDLKNYEIVQKIEFEDNYKFVEIKDKYFFIFYTEKGLLKIKRNIFNFKENCFEYKEPIETNIHNSYSLDILMTDNEYFLINNDEKLFILK